jgi:hypothetical protein
MREREAARKLCDEIDRALIDAGRREGDRSPWPLADEAEVARRLCQIGQGLPPVPTDLERRVRAIVQSPPVFQVRAARTWRSAAWGALVAAVVLASVWFVAPGGQEVWAGMLHALQLGQTRVELTPTLEPPTPAIRETLDDLVAAELLIGRAPSLPRALPDGYALKEIAAVSYPELPSWISQPFYIELCYGQEGAPPGLQLRQYRLLFREYGGISRFQPASAAVTNLEQVQVAGVSGTLLTISRDRETYIVLWERDGLLLELGTDSLPKAELLRIARSVR